MYEIGERICVRDANEMSSHSKYNLQSTNEHILEQGFYIASFMGIFNCNVATFIRFSDDCSLEIKMNHCLD